MLRTVTLLRHYQRYDQGDASQGEGYGQKQFHTAINDSRPCGCFRGKAGFEVKGLGAMVFLPTAHLEKFFSLWQPEIRGPKPRNPKRVSQRPKRVRVKSHANPLIRPSVFGFLSDFGYRPSDLTSVPIVLQPALP
jgi:hypothetical protein